jgi:hypothetical protein
VATEIDAAAFYASYVATYLERDVRPLANVGSPRNFGRFLRACALRSGNLLNKADLARDAGISLAPAWHAPASPTPQFPGRCPAVSGAGRKLPR